MRKHNKDSNIEQRITTVEKDIRKFKRFYKKNTQIGIIKAYRAQQTALLTFVGFVIALISIPTIYNVLTYNYKMTELDNKIQSQQYLSLANDASSIEERIEYYTFAIEHDKENPRLYYQRAQAYFDEGDYDMVITNCLESLKYDANFFPAKILCANIYYQRERYDRVIELLSDTYSPNYDSEILAYLECSYYYKNDYEKALQYFEIDNRKDYVNNLVKDNTTENVYVLTCNCYLKLNRTYEACLILSGFLSDVHNVDDVIMAANILIDIYDATADFDSKQIVDNLLSTLNEERLYMRNTVRGIPNPKEYQTPSKDVELLNELRWRVQELLDKGQ